MSTKWKPLKNRKEFLDTLAKKFKIESPHEWGKVTVSRIYNEGGSALLNEYYNGSLFECLKSVYRGREFFTF